MIDPALTWNTFLGGSGYDYSCDMAIDAGGNVVVVGYSTATWGTPVRASSASNDAYVAMLSGAGDVIWNTFLGGSGGDYSEGITVAASGNVYVSGYSSSSSGSPVRPKSSGYDGFAAKLTSSGTLTRHSFVGGSGTDRSCGIAVNGDEDVYLTGSSDASWGSPWRTYTSGYDACAVKLAGDGTLTWNAFFGGSGDDYSEGGVAEGHGGSVYMVGRSSADWGSPLRAYTAQTDAFVVELSDATTFAIAGVVFEDADFAGTASDFDGGISDAGQPSVDVDLYDSGDIYVTSTTTDASGANVMGVNFGFSYELIVNEDDDANADATRSKQGCLRQFIKNANAIAGVNRSRFNIPGS